MTTLPVLASALRVCLLWDVTTHPPASYLSCSHVIDPDKKKTHQHKIPTTGDMGEQFYNSA